MTSNSHRLICFDIDGVLLRGSNPISGAGEVLQELQKNNVPFIFLTNGCPTTETLRAEQLATVFDIKCDPKWVVMAQTPLCELESEHKKLHLVINQGDCRSIINATGFKNVVTIEDLCQKYPHLNTADRSEHSRPYKKHSIVEKIVENNDNSSSNTPINCVTKETYPKIEGIILLEDPLHWEICYQFILDILFTNGNLHQKNDFDYLSAARNIQDPIIPIYVGSSDFCSVTHSPWPRIANGAFIVGLEAIYKKITGTPLQYKKLYGKPNKSVYDFLLKRIRSLYPETTELIIVGDNPLTDIYGANVFKQLMIDNDITDLKITSILVKTGFCSGSEIDEQHIMPMIRLLSDYTPKNPEYLNSDLVFNNVIEFMDNFRDILIKK